MPPILSNLASRKWIYAHVPPSNGTRKGSTWHHKLSWSMIKKKPTQAQIANNNMITMINHMGNFFFVGGAAIGIGPAGT